MRSFAQGFQKRRLKADLYASRSRSIITVRKRSSIDFYSSERISGRRVQEELAAAQARIEETSLEGKGQILVAADDPGLVLPRYDLILYPENINLVHFLDCRIHSFRLIHIFLGLKLILERDSQEQFAIILIDVADYVIDQSIMISNEISYRGIFRNVLDYQLAAVYFEISFCIIAQTGKTFAVSLTNLTWMLPPSYPLLILISLLAVS